MTSSCRSARSAPAATPAATTSPSTRPMVDVTPGTIVVYSDLGCPWAHVAVWRLHDAWRRLGLEGRVSFDHRVFPLELFNSQPTPRNELEGEGDACSALRSE